MGRRTFFGTAICAVVAAGAMVVPASASGPATSASSKFPSLIGNCAKPKFKPRNVILTCGDASFGARNMNWTAWTQKSATGTGTGQINDCMPSCVQGQTKSAPIQLRASKPVKCNNVTPRIFSKVTWTWTSGAPTGPATGSVALGCKIIAGL